MSEEKSEEINLSSRVNAVWGDELLPVQGAMAAVSELAIEAHTNFENNSAIVILGMGYFLSICAKIVEEAIDELTSLGYELEDKGAANETA